MEGSRSWSSMNLAAERRSVLSCSSRGVRVMVGREGRVAMVVVVVVEVVKVVEIVDVVEVVLLLGVGGGDGEVRSSLRFIG